MSWKISKTPDEWNAFIDEVYFENHVEKRRYYKISEWPHLIVDLPNSLFEHMHYTLAHLLFVWPIYEIGMWVYQL